MKPRILCIKAIFFLVATFLWSPLAFPYPLQFLDGEGRTIVIKERPSRVVSLVPAITEILFGIGAGDAVKGITYYSTYPPQTAHAVVVGGFSSPSIKAIEALRPDVIFVTDLHREVKARFSRPGPQVIQLRPRTVQGIYQNIELLGKIFDREQKARALARQISEDLQVIARKVARIPPSGRKRAIRVMGLDPVMAPGDDSFQNEYIRLAGGIPPQFNKKGQIVSVSQEEWTRFNPQVIYSCGPSNNTLRKALDRPGWKDVDAVREGQIFSFPCDLTCRASTRAGLFVSWLSAVLYGEKFSRKDQQVFDERVTRSRSLDLPLDYLKGISIAESRVFDFLNQTLILDFKEPMTILSTLEGMREGILSVGNHSLPPPCWGIVHRLGLETSRKRIYRAINKTEERASFLFTGAQMDHLVIKQKGFKDMAVYALVTAGINSNAVRASKDTGGFYEPGTINIILLTNMKLSGKAMTRAVLTATEGKTAALMDMDIRSSYTPLTHQATGTGTDNIIVVSGEGRPIENTGGHSKMGELIARAVYAAVQEAVYKQDGVVGKRSVFRRLKERRISLFELVSADACECQADQSDLVKALEEVLLNERYASFIESSLALSDSYERGLIHDLGTYDQTCKQIAEEIAGTKIHAMLDLVAVTDIPLPLTMALNALLNGVNERLK